MLVFSFQVVLWTLSAAPYAAADRADRVANGTAAVLGPTPTVRSQAAEPLRRTMEGLDNHDSRLPPA